VLLYLAFFSLCGNVFAGKAQDISRILNSKYQGHVLTLRQFYEGSTVSYDPNGGLLKHGDVGSWTVDGVVLIHSILLTPEGLRFDCRRVEVAFERGQAHLYEDGDLQIDINRGGHLLTLDELDQALTKIFLIPEGHLLDVVPTYWRPFFYSHKRLYTKLQAQLARAGEPASKIEAKPANLAALSQAEPQFAPETRQAGRAVTASFRIRVDASGHVSEVTILQPVGLGLDDKAVKVIRAWKFKPASSNGVPVSTTVIVKVRYELTGGPSTRN
jgi:TonB family protein